MVFLAVWLGLLGYTLAYMGISGFGHHPVSFWDAIGINPGQPAVQPPGAGLSTVPPPGSPVQPPPAPRNPSPSGPGPVSLA